ncbi:MAG: type II toxin-antitoxin system HicB family antitoxin [Thaumarchaeota archaeon]|nr:type II toxin-antitoxin system HicB family antitoxin [Nitrososphaerota archaeon]
MSMKFSVKILKGTKNYAARVPELGITTQGKMREEAKKNLREAI